MLRKFVLPVCLIGVGAVGAFLIACGSSSSPAKNSACSGTYNIVGDWQGSITANGASDDLIGVINAAGDGAFVDSAADILTVSSLTGACSFTSTVGVYASIEGGGPATSTGTATGNVTSASAISGSETTNGATGTFSFSSYNPLGTGSVTAISENNTSSFYIEGQREDYNVPVSVSGTSSSMTVSGTDVFECDFNGTFTEESTNNVYDVNLVVSGTGCNPDEVVAGTYTGIGFESDSDLLGLLGVGEQATGPYLYAILTANSAPFVMEILPPAVPGDRAHHQQRSTNFSKVLGLPRHVSR